MKPYFILIIIMLFLLVGQCHGEKTFLVVQSNQNITLIANTQVPIIWSEELIDLDNNHAAGSSIFTINRSGYYRGTLNYYLGDSASSCRWMLNGSRFNPETITYDSTKNIYTMSSVMYLNAGTYFTTNIQVATNKTVVWNSMPMNRFSLEEVNQTDTGESEMTDSQFYYIYGALALCALMCSLLLALKLWYFIGGDGT